MVAMWGSGEFQHVLNPDMPWNEEIRAAWARQERLAASPRTASSHAAAHYRTGRAGGPPDNPRADPRHPSHRRPIRPARGASTSLITYRARNTLSCRGATGFTSLNRGVTRFRRSPSSSPGTRPTWPMIGSRHGAFTDIVDSTRRAAEMGDRDWHALLDAHDAVVRSQLARFRGREVNTSGDGFLAMFDGPQRAIRCAMAIRDAVQALGIEVRAGLHTGECEVRGDDIGGIAVHIGARVSALAGPNDVLVSSTLRDLVIGSGLEFEDRGAHELKGVPGEWHLFAVASP